MNTIDLPYLHECLRYDPDSGLLFWKERPLGHFQSEVGHSSFNSKFFGRVAGSKGKQGYIRVSVGGVKMPAHRVAWALMYGEFPATDIDHLDGVRDNNRKTNLRLASRRENHCNSKRAENNTSGYKGVGFHKSSGLFRARSKVNGKVVNLGYGKTAEEAYKLYCEFVKDSAGEFARLA